MFVLPIVALGIGIALAIVLRFQLGGLGGQYLAVACLAGLDTVLGGVRAGLDGKYNNLVFVTGFLGNVLVAFFLAYLGDQIYINLWLAVALALGTRIFNNLSFIRRLLLTRYEDYSARRKREAAAAASSPTGVEAAL
ncbi:DUF1290 domain-containing protein [bacterium]|nr:MAG: DUF1290 domain-containing protein [bacterium]